MGDYFSKTSEKQKTKKVHNNGKGFPNPSWLRLGGYQGSLVSRDKQGLNDYGVG